MTTDKAILITVSGPDKPGITHRLMEIIENAKSEIIDIGQSVTHKYLNLSILIKQNEGTAEPILKNLLFEAKKMGLWMDFDVIERDTSPRNEDKFLITCVAKEKLDATFLKELSSIIAEESVNIQRIDNLNQTNFSAIEFQAELNPQKSKDKFKSRLLALSTTHEVDIAVIKNDLFRRNKKLIIFDMDSTLIQAEVIDEIAKEMNVGEQVSKITERAMNGKIDFSESLRERVKLLKGMEISKLQEILDRIELTPGVEDFVHTIKKLGMKMAIISGGFTFFADAIKEKLGLDYAFANKLGVLNNKLTGEVEGKIVDAEQKALLLNVIAQQEGANLNQVVAIGDGANDLPMLNEAGLGIAFHAKEIVKKSAEQNLSHGPMTSILYFLGLTQ